MKLQYGDDIDTKCIGCKGNAVDFVVDRDARRLYACEDCLQHLLRNAEIDDLGELSDHPTAAVCADCGRLTLFSKLNLSRKCPSCTP